MRPILVSSRGPGHERAMDKPALQALECEFAIHRFPQDAPVLPAVFASPFYRLGRTDEELSIVCESSIDLAGGVRNAGWSCLKVLGPIDFSVTGTLAGITVALAAARISIFAVSTFDTDYILVRSADLERAMRALEEAGYRVLK